KNSLRPLFSTTIGKLQNQEKIRQSTKPSTSKKDGNGNVTGAVVLFSLRSTILLIHLPPASYYY
ncbi:hypothetical protein WUBG_12305, partial [Wuchereria bancrofti]